MTAYIDRILRAHAATILKGHVAIPDDEEELNWHAFFEHSQDMQGFRADLFTNGSQGFVGLRKRAKKSSKSSSGFIRRLGVLWADINMREGLTHLTNGSRSKAEKAKGIGPALDLLLRTGNAAATTFAQALQEFRGTKAARKTNKMIRAYVQNCHKLTATGGSYKGYLVENVHDAFPPKEAVAAEEKIVRCIQRDFYNVGPTLAPYMICDVMLWHWLHGGIQWFESYKPDSVHNAAVRDGKLPPEAQSREGFISFCKRLQLPAEYDKHAGQPCPPRLLNECIWLEESLSATPRTRCEQRSFPWSSRSIKHRP